MILCPAHRTEAADPRLKELEVFPSVSYRLRYLGARFSPVSLIGLHCSKVVRGIREAEGIKGGSSRARKTEADIRYICLKYTGRTTRFKPGGYKHRRCALKLTVIICPGTAAWHVDQNRKRT